MSSIIQKVSYSKEDAKSFLNKLGEHIGIQKLNIVLIDGGSVEGIISEVGQDFISVIEEGFDTIIPVSNIQLCRYSR